MSLLVTGSAGHLGEALMRRLRADDRAVLGIDLQPSAFTDAVGSITDRAFVRHHLQGVRAVLHTATLHKPHLVTHSRQDFVDTNVTGTLVLLEEALAAGVECFVFTSTTSTFGAALRPPPGEPAAWVTEEVLPIPRNIYGVSKLAAESLCELFFREHGLPVLVLRTSRFFPEADDDASVRGRYSIDNVRLVELLYRRVDLEDVVSAHFLALQRARELGFGRYILSATTPFVPQDLPALRGRAHEVVYRLFPEAEALMAARGWQMFPDLDRVYVNTKARAELGWEPRYDFGYALRCLREGRDLRSELAREVGSKGYHTEGHTGAFAEGPYPVR
jgi:UDP-glucose 4-epimerase